MNSDRSIAATGHRIAQREAIQEITTARTTEEVRTITIGTIIGIVATEVLVMTEILDMSVEIRVTTEVTQAMTEAIQVTTGVTLVMTEAIPDMIVVIQVTNAEIQATTAATPDMSVARTVPATIVVTLAMIVVIPATIVVPATTAVTQDTIEIRVDLMTAVTHQDMIPVEGIRNLSIRGEIPDSKSHKADLGISPKAFPDLLNRHHHSLHIKLRRCHLMFPSDLTSILPIPAFAQGARLMNIFRPD
jgi:hypothetical protein